MKLLLFSDVHRDLSAVRQLVAQASDADVAVCAGDLAVMRAGLREVVDALSAISIPCVLVPGNGESDTELADACAHWAESHVLHGSGVEIDGTMFWGIGGAIPITPFGDWSFDLTESEGEGLLSDCPAGAVLVSHSPPYGHVDEVDGQHLGSRAVLEAIRRCSPRLVVCGHIHACWRQESRIASTRVVNAGPKGLTLEI